MVGGGGGGRGAGANGRDSHKGKGKAGERLHGVQAGGVSKVMGGMESKPKLCSSRSATAEQHQHQQQPKIEEIEAEFWRLVESPVAGRVVETLYGSDLDSGRTGKENRSMYTSEGADCMCTSEDCRCMCTLEDCGCMCGLEDC
eukprot:1138242-Pelagomonas_calceolata.AAC.3